MRDAIKSALSFTWSMSLFGVRQVLSLFPSRGGADTAGAFDSVSRAAAEQLDEPLRAAFRAGEEVMERAFEAWGCAACGAGSGGEAAPEPGSVDLGRLDGRRFVALGEGLAAGVVDFALAAEGQRASFPALLARQMGVAFPQVLLQAPGVGNLPGLPPQPVILPTGFQTTVAEPFPPPGTPANLSWPGLRLADVFEVRPRPPVIHRRDAAQTAANLILGLGALVRGEEGPLPTALEAALGHRPTFALVELGYHEALAAALGEGPALPSAGDFQAAYGRLLAALRGAGAEVLALTIPDPADTAACSPLEAAGRTLKVEPGALAAAYGLDPGDRLTVQGLYAVGYQLLAGATEALPPGSVVPAGRMAEVSEAVAALNGALATVAREHGAHVYDLAACVRRLRREGLAVANRRLTADYLGGFFSLNGAYPGATGHALIADELGELINRTYGAHIAPPDIAAVAAADPVADYRPPRGSNRDRMPAPAAPGSAAPAGTGGEAAASVPGSAGGAGPATTGGAGEAPPARPLELPPGGKQVLPLHRPGSYHGDAIRVVDCGGDRDGRWGSCGGLFFGGLALFQSHLSGNLRLELSPPVDGVSELAGYLDGGLAGDDSVLSAPQLFRLPARGCRVGEVPGAVLRGKLHLATGEVTDLTCTVRFLNSALAVLAQINPHFPTQPIAFPGRYGSAEARCEPRDDGKLDFTFYGSTFLPLGKEMGGETVRYGLPFASAEGNYASFPSRGLTLHPHLRLTTRVEAPAAAGEAPSLPANSVEELTLFTHNSAFGDEFTLETDELRGPAVGRSHLAGRLSIQLGEPGGGSQPVVISSLPPGGYLGPAGDSPLAAQFPGRLPAGPMGHDEFLRFPLRSYFLDAVRFIDDPFDVALGAVDSASGRLINSVLHRGFIGQDLFYALVRIEPRTPRSSFFFRGPARFERTGAGGFAYRFEGKVMIPYPPGFKFPAPDLTTHYVAGPGSRLDPYLWFRGQSEAEPDAGAVLSGQRQEVRSSTGEIFSYTYSIPADPARNTPFFEYTNHSQEGAFRLHTLVWAGFTTSLGAAGSRPDTVSFSGFGSWSKDGKGAPHLVTAQISTAPGAPYVSIQIDGGEVSNVNTKPEGSAARP